MLDLYFTLALTLAPVAQKPAPPDAQRVKTVVAELEKSLKSGSKEEKSKAIQSSAEVPDADVAKALGKGIADKDLDVQRSAIEALRWMEHPAALEELLDAARTRKELRKEPTAYAALLRAIGQHGNPKAIDALKDDLWSVVESSVVEARILGLGNVRDKRSVEALMDLMKVAGPNRIQNVMPSFRLALARLTGVDKGQSQQMWQDWWNDNKGKFTLPEKAPELARELQFRWDSYWEKERPYERMKRRGERGKGDPEKDGESGKGGEKPREKDTEKPREKGG